MKHIVITTPLSEISSRLYRKLYSLTLRLNVGLRPTLVELRHPENPKLRHFHQGKNRYPPKVHYVISGEDVLGWALSFDYYSYPWAYFYVRKSARRRGIGRALLNSCARWARQVTGFTLQVSPHDRSSAAFFESGSDVKIQKIWQMSD